METVGRLLLYLLAFVLLYFVLPKILFSNAYETGHTRFFSNYIRMNLLVIVTGYLLAFLKLFELAAVFFVFTMVIIRNKRRVRKLKNLEESFSDEIYYWIYDYTDGLIHLPGLIKGKIKDKWTIAQKKWIGLNRWEVLHLITVLFVFSYSGVIRFTDALINAAPAMSDAYVTLAWIKYIGSNQLFHDGIYPHGYHIYMALLQKLTSMDPLYILKFSGPLASMFILYSLYYFVSKMLKSKTAGLVSVAVYGIFGSFLTATFARQSATNAQEYGFVFILPCLYFIVRYMTHGKKGDLMIVGTALTVTGLVHTLSFVYTAVWIVVIYAVFLLAHPKKETLQKFKPLLIMGFTASAFMMIPITIGKIFGIPFHGSSLEFAVATVDVAIPNIIFTDYLVLGSLGIAFIYIIFKRIMKSRKKDETDDWTALVCVFMIGLTSVCMYFFAGYITKSLVVASRAGEIYALTVSVIIGLGFYSFVSLFLYPLKELKQKVITGVGLALVVVMTLIISPDPIIPYKMEYNSNIEQYFRICKEVRDTEWLMVSQEEGYATCLGKGWHLMAKDFLALADPKNPFVSMDSTKDAISVPYIFIYIEEEPYETYKQMDSLLEAYQRRLIESGLLKKWVEEYQRENKDMVLYYQDLNLTVYRIYRPQVGDRFSEKVLGPKG